MLWTPAPPERHALRVVPNRESSFELDLDGFDVERFWALLGRPFPLAGSAVRTRELVAEVGERFSARGLIVA